MEFFLSIFFLVIYYLRPQDWVPGLIGANLIKPIILVWCIGLLIGRSKPSPLPGLMRTPHDWTMVTYIFYLFIVGDAALLGVLPLFAFYAMTVQSLTTWDRLLRYLKFWNWSLVMVAVMAVASLYGMDLTGAQDNRFTEMGRLAIGTWLHNNPNSLGHSVIVVVALSYILYFWKSGAFSRFVVFPVAAGLTFYCAWETQSKGAYLVGAALCVLIFVVGRPKMVQIIAILAALIGGVSALSFLPRMQNMSSLQQDEGVQGRLLAWEMARTVAENEPTGVGWNQFVAEFPWREGDNIVVVKKATHSSYVQVAADLGKVGLFLYLAGIWTAFYTLMKSKSDQSIQERCRRALFILLVANILSGWMINRQYHTEYFLLIASAGAMHRLRKADELAIEEKAGRESKANDRPSDTEEKPSQGGWLPPAPVVAFSTSDSTLSPRSLLRMRIHWTDVMLCLGFTWLTFWVWDLLLERV